MFTIKGFYNDAVVYAHASDVDQGAIDQIKELLARPFVKDSTIRIMSDVHSGAGCVIGTTMTICDSVVPNLVGVDIGCGLEVVRLAEETIDLAKLDAFIHRTIPAGFKIRDRAHPYNDLIDLTELNARSSLDLPRARLSIGTLGGGNHFIEINTDEDAKCYLVVHSGSRHIGLQVATHYQKIASKGTRDPLAALEGAPCEQYLSDMRLMQRYADLNRKAIADAIIEAFALTVVDRFSTIHNYIDTEEMILRKGGRLRPGRGASHHPAQYAGRLAPLQRQREQTMELLRPPRSRAPHEPTRGEADAQPQRVPHPDAGRPHDQRQQGDPG